MLCTFDILNKCTWQGGYVRNTNTIQKPFNYQNVDDPVKTKPRLPALHVKYFKHLG